MKKFLFSSSLILTFAAYAAIQGNAGTTFITPPVVAQNPSLPLVRQTSSSPPPNNGNNPGGNSSSVTPNPKPTPISPSTPNPTPKANIIYKDGTFTGNTVDAFYGNVQVAVSMKSDKIVDVQFLDYPRERSNSVLINGQATPILRTEAIQAQSAEIDIVSGATFTSKAFKTSLASALAKARN